MADLELCLPEELLLLTLHEQPGSGVAARGTDSGLAAALLLELAQAGCLVHEGGGIVLRRCELPAVPVLAETLTQMRGSAQGSGDAQHWLHQLPQEMKPLTGRVASRLVQHGMLTEQRHRILGIVPQTRYRQTGPEPGRLVRERLLDVLVRGTTPELRTALLLVTMLPLGLIRTLVEPPHRADAERRGRDIADHVTASSPLRGCVRDAQAAILMTTTTRR